MFRRAVKHSVHFIGIGGIGISAVARMMLHEGKKVSGQDMQGGEIVDELVKLGINIKIGQSYENIPADADLIVYTIAIDTYDPDLAKKIKGQDTVPVRSYPQMLGEVTKDKYTIAVCGTHGKTTTTAMIAQILDESGKSPTVIVGSLIKGKDGSRTNFIAGDSDPASPSQGGPASPSQGGPASPSQGGIFVVEACEYRRSFLNINPKVLVITNIDEDHLDYYKDIEDIKNAFHEMAMKVPADGFVICNPDDENVGEVVKGINAKVINWQEFYNKNLKLKVPGVHNKKDAAAAVAASTTLSISKEEGEILVGNFPGTWRRFEFKGKLAGGVLVYDDYAHHPHEIMATMEGFRELYSKEAGWKITVVFQPHLFSRTKSLLNDFAQSFKDVDEVLLLPIYYAREVDDGTISSEILSNEINKYTNNSKAFSSFEDIENYLKNKTSSMREKDVIVTMGAGEAFKVGDFLLK